MKKIITLALFLAVVAGLSGAALSFVFQMTNPILFRKQKLQVRENF